MQTKAKCAVALLLVVVVGLCACSPQKSLAHRLADADRVVVTNQYDKTSISITGEEVQEITKALAASKKISSDGLCSTPEHRLVFFKGTNHLITVSTSYLIFWINQTPYHDKSGTLSALYVRLWHGEVSPLTP